MNRYWIITCIILGIALAALTVWWLFPARCDKPITCSSDKQCGGEVLGEKFCKDDSVWSHGQQNVCQNSGTCSATCTTSYVDILVEKCKTGCSNGVCAIA